MPYGIETTKSSACCMLGLRKAGREKHVAIIFYFLNGEKSRLSIFSLNRFVDRISCQIQTFEKLD